MVSDRDIVTVSLTPVEVQFVRAQARNAEIGGQSQIRAMADRQENLAMDQIVGQVGTYAGHKLLFGNALFYRISRWYADIYPTLGDGGSDVPGANVDFKASCRRSGRSLLDYRLAVRPKERHAGMVYVLVLVESDLSAAHIVGWAREAELPAVTESGGVFAGAYVLDARSLNPMMPLQWFARVA